MQSGNLSEYPLPELVREVVTRKLSGALRLERERAKVVAYFENGEPVFAAANVRELRLGEYLVKTGHLTATQLSDFPKNISDAALAATLTSTGTVKVEAVKETLTKVVTDTLRVALLWPDGIWEFDGRARLADSVRVKITAQNLLVESARKMALKLVAARFTDMAEVISPHADVSTAVGLTPSEAFVLSRLDQPMSLNDVVALSGLPESDALRVIYCLALAGHINRGAWAEVLKLTKATEPPASKSSVERQKPTTGPLPSDEEDLKGFLARIDNAADHYGVLAVTSTASIDDIKRAYYSLARRYHPDRFHLDATVHSRIESAFARITQAYEVLTDTAQRPNYDAKLAAQDRARHFADAAPKADEQQRTAEESVTKEPGFAERSFRDGYAALQMGQLNVALTHLAAAAHEAPRESRYRAYYGQALATDGRSQRMAESELQAAVRLEPNNPSYHVMLAQLYYDLTFSHRAQAEAERALQLDPDNASAMALLRKLEKK